MIHERPMTGTQGKTNPQEKRKGRNPLYQSPLGILLTLSLIIFLVETMIMLAIALYPPHLSLHLLTVLDPLLLVLLLSPALYFLVFRPMMIAHIREHSQVEQEKQSLHDQLVQSQKLESLGRLAGGVAHDFNNILTAIIGYSELALARIPDDHTIREYLNFVLTGGERAATLTRQLLAFSRKQQLEVKVINLNHIISDTAKMLERLIGEDISLELNLQSPLKNVEADPAHVEQILMNLAVNARDAMPGGGRLIIETMNIEHGAGDAGKEETRKPGAYVMVSITDNGEGMSREVRDQIFEPFFTTKEVGKGTGLGLSIVYGIVIQHNGHIDVYSEPGQGTTFKICFPATEGRVEEEGEVEPPRELTGTETILVVEDDASIRSLIVDIFEPLGYRILAASNAFEALKVSDNFTGAIDLLLTDVIMPGMTGKELAELLKSKRPETKVIFMSGYTDSVIAHYGAENQEIRFVQKPLTPRKLSSDVREVLDQGMSG